MTRPISLTLTDESWELLENVAYRGQNWRARERARTLLLLGEGYSKVEVALQIGVHPRTVATTRLAWLRSGSVALHDLPRSGAPKKMSEDEIRNVVAIASAEPLTAKALLARHIEGGGVPVHLNTLTAALRNGGMVWKRTRHSLKKKE